MNKLFISVLMSCRFIRKKKMTVSLQVFYPTENNTTFDHAYYDTKHIAIVDEHMTPHTESVQIVKGLAGGSDVPAGFHTVATMIFKDQAALDSALAAAGPALEDIPNFFSGQPQMLIGKVQE
jgi:uncharacterized protein (TIGR02118 family)